jgi:uncharacterized protein (TIGR03435 family)
MTIAASAVVSAQNFEASEVRLNRSGSSEGSIVLEPGGRLVIRNSTFREMLLTANYNLSKRLMNLLGGELIAGGPSWIDSDRFDLVAKAQPDAPPETVRSMLQSVLVNRFHLAFHREVRPLRAYALKASYHVKLRRSLPGNDSGCGPSDGVPGLIHRVCHNMTMDALTAALPRIASYYVDLLVVDRSGLDGAYDFRLDWAPIRRAEDEAGGTPVIGDAGGATIFDAIGRLGLKLEEGRYPIPVVVVDRVEKLAERAFNPPVPWAPCGV